MALSTNDFGKAVVAAGLILADELKTLLAACAAEIRPKSAAALSKLLVEQGHLTRYQADELLEGRGPALVLGEYVIQDKIGAGGMGQVLQAEHRKMGRTVALKLMSTAAMKDEAAIKRFHREVKAAARLEHENIVTAHAAGEARGMHYLVMQYVEGNDLSGRVKKEGPLSVDLAMNCICQAARGLAYAHSEGIIHRDIKPANLLLDKKGVVKILDMGLARIDDGGSTDGLTGTEQVLGTVDYMSPEQSESTRNCDARADIYSLGCTLWYLLTGTKVYPGETAIQRIMAHRDAPVPSLLKARDDVPWALEKLFHRMIAKRAEDRCQTMGEVVRELEQIRGVPESSRTNALDEDTQLGHFFKTLDSQEPSRPATKVKAAASQTSAPDEPTLDHGDSVKVAGKSARQNPPAKNAKVLIGAGAAGLLVLLFGVFIYLRSTNQKGEEVGRKETPPGQTAKGTNPKAVSTAGPTVATAQSTPPQPLLAPFDAQQAKAGQQAWAQYLNTTVEQKNSLGMSLLLIPPGEFLMGGTDADVAAIIKDTAEKDRAAAAASLKYSLPQHKVTLTRPFALAATEVTVAQFSKYIEVTGYKTDAERDGQGGTDQNDPARKRRPDLNWSNPGHPQTDDSPVSQISWNDAAAFCNWLSARAKLKLAYSRNEEDGWYHLLAGANGYRLPTEAEWEYACRAGTTTINYWGSDVKLMRDYASAGKNPSAVATRLPNAFGLFDMQGNMRELVNDFSANYESSPLIDPTGPTTGKGHISRGGFWTGNVPQYANSIYRTSDAGRNYAVGFRVARSLETPASSPATGYALDFSPERQSYVEVPDWKYDGKTPLTVEAWVMTRKKDGADVIGRPDPDDKSPTLSLMQAGSGKWRFTLVQSKIVESNESSNGDLVHLAGVFDGSQIAFYVNGQKQNKTTSAQQQAGEQSVQMLIGARFRPKYNKLDTFFDGTIDEVRISSVARYTSDFTPQQRFEPDKDTEVLYHFDEGAGTVVKDSSPHHRDGKIVGAIYVAGTLRVPSAPALVESDATRSVPATLSQTDLLTSPDYEWTEPEKFGFNGGGTVISGDSLTAVSVGYAPKKNEQGESQNDLWIRERASLDEPFGKRTALEPSINSSSQESDPWLSVDGSTLLFGTNRPGVYSKSSDLWQATRKSRSDPFANAASLGESVNAGGPVYGGALSADGLVLVLESLRKGGLGGHDLWQCRCKDLQSPFSAPEPLGSTVNSTLDEERPWLSSDGRVLLFDTSEFAKESSGKSARVAGSGTLWMAVRPSIDAPFGPRQKLPPPINRDGVDNGTASITTDGKLLIFCSQRAADGSRQDVWLSRRVPKPGTIAEFNGHRYQWVEGEIIWSDAKKRAEQMGGHLATVTSAAENDWLKANLLTQLPKEKMVWIGASHQAKSDPWIWVTGEPFDFNDWQGGDVSRASAAAGIFRRSRDSAFDWAAWESNGRVTASSGDTKGEGRNVGFIIEWDAPAVRADYALDFSPERQSYVEVPEWKYDGTTPLTIEAWVTPRAKSTPEIDQRTIVSDEFQAGFSLHCAKNSVWTFTVRGMQWAQGSAKGQVELNRQTHLAGVFDGRTIWLYVDGRRQEKHFDIELPYSPSSRPVLIGAKMASNLQLQRLFDGTIDEVRISSVARYTTDFTPKQRFEPDAATEVLYHFDEGAGAVAKDSSPHKRDGKINGAMWVATVDSGKPQPSANLPSALPNPQSPDRAVAEWVIGKHGVVRPAGAKTNIDVTNQLPSGSFELEFISLSRGSKTPIKADVISEDDLQPLLALKSLKSLNLNAQPSLGDTAAKTLARIATLESLQLATTQVGDEGCKALADLSNLRSLQLTATAVSDAGLEHLAKLKKLTTFHVGGVKITAAGVARLQKALPNCKIEWDGDAKTEGANPTAANPQSPDRAVAEWVLMVGGQVGVAAAGKQFSGIANVKDLPAGSLELVDINLRDVKTFTDADIERLRGLEHLKGLSLYETGITGAGVGRLPALPALKTLHLGANGWKQTADEASATALGRLTNLERLVLQGLVFKSEQLSTLLSRLPRLVQLELSQAQIDDTALAAIARFPQLKIVHVGQSSSYSDAGVAELLPLGELETLNISDNQNLTDAVVDTLARMKTLKSLRIARSYVTVPAIDRLRKALPNCSVSWSDRYLAERTLQTGGWVTVVTVTGKRIENITDPKDFPSETYAVESLEGAKGKLYLESYYWQGSQQLKSIILAGAQADDESVRYLSGPRLPLLALLDFSDTQVDDRTIDRIAGAKSLKQVNLRGTKVTADGVAKLQKVLPNCKIEWDDPAKAASPAK